MSPRWVFAVSLVRHRRAALVAMVLTTPGLALPAGAGSAAVTVSVSPPIQNVVVDELLGVDIFLDTAGAEVGGGGVFLAFDALRLQLVGGEVNGDTWNDNFITSPPREMQPGIVSFSVGAAPPAVGDRVRLASLVFLARAPGSALLSFLFNENAEETVFMRAGLVERFETNAVGARVAVRVPATATSAPATPTTTLAATATPTPLPTSPSAACAGDCSGDDAVTVDEVVLMVQIALGSISLAACPAGDPSGDGDITVDEILSAVNHALEGCPAAG